VVGIKTIKNYNTIRWQETITLKNTLTFIKYPLSNLIGSKLSVINNSVDCCVILFGNHRVKQLPIISESTKHNEKLIPSQKALKFIAIQSVRKSYSLTYSAQTNTVFDFSATFYHTRTNTLSSLKPNPIELIPNIFFSLFFSQHTLIKKLYELFFLLF